VIDVRISIVSHSNEKMHEFNAPALINLTIWIQSFIVSDNSFGKTQGFSLQARSHMPNFVVPRKICFKHAIKTEIFPP